MEVSTGQEVWSPFHVDSYRHWWEEAELRPPLPLPAHPCLACLLP